MIFGFLLLAALLLTGCMGDAEKSIQGTWEWRSEHLMTKASEQHLTVIWFFNNGTFSYQACCFNIDEEISGRYRVISVEENILMLELYNMRGSQYRLASEVRIKINPDDGSLTIQSASPFYKLEPTSSG